MALGQGSLQVYSARQSEPIYASDTGWRDSNLLGNPFDYDLAHTDYTILTQDGKTLQYVRNAHNAADPMPALVPVPPVATRSNLKRKNTMVKLSKW